jgi:hypothetical protein
MTQDEFALTLRREVTAADYQLLPTDGQIRAFFDNLPADTRFTLTLSIEQASASPAADTIQGLAP